jgi:hypothetical protein
MKSIYALVLYALLGVAVAWAIVHFEAHHYVLSH